MKSITNKIRLATLVAAAILAGGCEKETDNEVDNTPVAARITSTIDAMATRAAGTTWAEGDAIGITAATSLTGIKYANIKYHTTTADGIFTPAGSMLQDVIYFQSREMTFTAYYPYVVNGTASGPNADGILSKTITAAEQTPEGQAKFDYLFATDTANVEKPEVQFRFSHCMSRLVLKFLKGDGFASLNDLTYTIGALAWNGTFDTRTGKTETGDTGNLEGLSVPYDASGMSSTLIVFPQQADKADITIVMNRKTYQGTIELPENPANGNVRGLLAGHSYTYNIKVNDRRLIISPANIDDWGDGNTIDGGAFLP